MDQGSGALPVPPPTGLTEQLQYESLWAWVGAAAGTLWIPAFLALIHDQRRTAQVLTILATAPLLVVMLEQVSLLLVDPGSAPWFVSGWVVLGIDAAVVLGMFAFHAEAPSPRPRPWLIAGACTFAALCVAIFLAPRLAGWVLVDEFGVWCLVAVVAAIAVSVVGRAWASVRRAQAHLGLALLCAAALALRVTTVLEIGWSAWPTAAQIGLVVQLVLVAVLATVCTISGTRQVRALPRVSYARA